MATATEAAPAKVNLTLHVTGQRSDGYHLLDSLVVFVDVADQVTVEPAQHMSLQVTGPRADGVPADARNLVWQAAELVGPATIKLDKRLPAAAGIGGGSSDAAACLRALVRGGVGPMPAKDLVLTLGADVPVCLNPVSQRMRGVGEILSDVAGLPPLWLVLVNPGAEVPTPAVFKALTHKTNPPMPDPLPVWCDAGDFARWLATQRNDLEPPAQTVAPVVSEVLAALADLPGCLMARMSGSGATCFGVFAQEQAAHDAHRALRALHTDWWSACGAVTGRSGAQDPVNRGAGATTRPVPG